MMKRIGLFMLTNLLVIVTISIVMNVLGVGRYITPYGLDYKALMIFCLLWGMGGAFISLAISRWVAKFAMGVQVVDPRNPGEFSGLVDMVHDLAQKAGLPAMPEVGIYQSGEVNAFATGPSKSRSLVAVSTGLLERMDRHQIKGVLGHEVAHIANGDMVTMTLLQGVLNAFVMFIARIIAFAVGQTVREEARWMVHLVVTIVLEVALSFLAMFVVAGFSRYREFRADRGGAQLAGTGPMVLALQGLQRVSGHSKHDNDHDSLQTFKISSNGKRMMALLSTHPPLEERIARLQATG